jgi:uncharacterized protein YcbK (DUF882 family)
MEQLTKNFNEIEFQSKDGLEMPEELKPNLVELAGQLQILRDYLEEPVRILSGYRSPEHNKAIGGAKLSQHVLVKAADITVKSKSPKQLKKIVEKLISDGKLKFKGIGLYAGFIHVDTRLKYARW